MRTVARCCYPRTPHLPDHLQRVIQTAAITGWRIKSELFTRQWQHVDFSAGWLRLEPGEAKTDEGRMFPLIPALRHILDCPIFVYEAVDDGTLIFRIIETFRVKAVCLRQAAQMPHVFQIGGALAILAAFVLAQAGVLNHRSIWYLALNCVGAAVLTVDAYLERQWGFVLLEGVWTIVSAWGLVPMREPGKHAASHGPLPIRVP